MREAFGSEVLTSLKSFLANLPRDEADTIVFEKVYTSRSLLEAAIPSSFMSEFTDIEREARRLSHGAE